MKESSYNEDDIDIYRESIIKIAEIVSKSKFMEDEPNDNTNYQMALAYQSMAATQVIFFVFP